MKKETIILFILLSSFIFLTEYLFYPEYILSRESGGLFLTTTDYLQEYLLAPGGMNNLLSNFLTQFYSPLLQGLLIQTGILLLVAIILFGYLSRWNTADHGWIISIPIVLFCIYEYAWNLSAILQYGCFILLLSLYLSSKSYKIRQLATLVISPLLYVCFPENCLLLLYIYFIGFEYLFFKHKRFPIVVTIGLFIVALYPLIWRDFIHYTPNNSLYVFTNQSYDIRYSYLYYALYIFPLCPILLLRWKENRYITFTILILILMAGGYSIYSSPNRARETRYAVQRYAENQEWDQVLQAINSEKATEPFYQPYIMLSLCEKNLLTEQLFSYPIESADRIFFPADQEEGANFNSLFAHSIGLYHEAIHQLSQANAMSVQGTSFSYLRRMIDWQIEGGNTLLASKYLNVLKTSTCHNSWVQKRTDMISKSTSDLKEGYKNDFIIDASSPLILLTQAVKADTTNRKAIDYLLCGVLLCKDLKGFYTLFQQYYPQEEEETFPKHYQEALLVVDLMFPQLNVTETYPITPACRQAFEDFGTLMRQRPNTDHILKQKYGNTYWYYGFMRTA